jgi:hypothetical protein
MVFNSRRSHETRILKVGNVEESRKLTFFFGAKGVNPFDNILPYLDMETVQEAREMEFSQNASTDKRRKRRQDDKEESEDEDKTTKKKAKTTKQKAKA